MPVRCDAAILSENWGISAVGQRCGKRSNDPNLPMVLDLQLGRKAPHTSSGNCRHDVRSLQPTLANTPLTASTMTAPAVSTSCSLIGVDSAAEQFGVSRNPRSRREKWIAARATLCDGEGKQLR